MSMSIYYPDTDVTIAYFNCDMCESDGAQPQEVGTWITITPNGWKSCGGTRHICKCCVELIRAAISE